MCDSENPIDFPPRACFYSPVVTFVGHEKLGAKTLRSFHEAAGSAGSGPPRPPMRLSYYGGGHYDSVAPIDSPVPSAMDVSPLGEGAAAGAAGAAATSSGGGPAVDLPASGGQLGTVATDVAGAVDNAGTAVNAGAAGAAGAPLVIPEPGQLEDAALERSRRRAAEAGSGRYR